jgi:hypothetical protein
MSSLEIVYEDQTLKQAYARNVHVAAWFDAPTVAQMHAYGRCARALSQRYGGQSCLVNLVVGGVPRFSAEVREVASQYTREGAHGVGAAHVILAPGLVGTSVRAFLSTVILLGRPPNPTKVFGDIDGAAEWMARNLAMRSSEIWEAKDVADACRRVIALVDQAAST